MESQSRTRLSMHTISKQILTDADILHPSRINHAQAYVSLAVEGPTFSTMASFSVLSMGILISWGVCMPLSFPSAELCTEQELSVSGYVDG